MKTRPRYLNRLLTSLAMATLVLLSQTTLAAPSTGTPSTGTPRTITDANSLAASCHVALTAIEKGLEAIPAEDQVAPYVCMAYISGVLDAAHHANNLSKLRFAQITQAAASTSAPDYNLYCIDWNMRHEDAARIILRYARQHMELVAQPAEKLVMKALRDAYPCKD